MLASTTLLAVSETVAESEADDLTDQELEQIQEEVVVDETEMIDADVCEIGEVSDYVDKYLVRLEKIVPALAAFDQDFSYRYIVTAKDKIKKIVVEDQIPEGATYISSSPTAQIDGDTVTWTLYNVEKGEIVPLELVVNASTIADFSNCASIVAYPAACTTTKVALPVLEVQKTTPVEDVLIGSYVPWSVTVANTGNFCAEDVVLTGVLPEGLAYLNSDSSGEIEIGTLTPGESRNVSIYTTATQAGDYCNVSVATASNAASAEAEVCINILEPRLEIDKEGPEVQFVGKSASYTITVRNTGDVAFNDVVITDTAPESGKFLSAEGAEIDGNIATWITNLDAGEEQSFEVEVTAKSGGTHCGKASLTTNDSSLSTFTTTCTEWRGYPALLVEVLDTQDPLIVGEETTYIIQVANQGTAADTNITLDIQVPDGLEIISVDGDTEGTITGNEISFAPYPMLNAKEIIQFRVIAKALETGDLRFKAQMNSDLLSVPVPEEEATQVY